MNHNDKPQFTDIHLINKSPQQQSIYTPIYYQYFFFQLNVTSNNMKAKKNLLVYVTIVLIISPYYYTHSKILHEDAICDEVDACFSYCEVYVDGISANPTRECCDNLLILNGRVKYIDNGVRRYCYCIEGFSNSHYHHPYLQSRIQNMSRICDIHRSFPISEHMDCSKYVYLHLFYILGICRFFIYLFIILWAYVAGFSKRLVFVEY